MHKSGSGRTTRVSVVEDTVSDPCAIRANPKIHSHLLQKEERRYRHDDMDMRYDGCAPLMFIMPHHVHVLRYAASINKDIIQKWLFHECIAHETHTPPFTRGAGRWYLYSTSLHETPRCICNATLILVRTPPHSRSPRPQLQYTTVLQRDGIQDNHSLTRGAPSSYTCWCTVPNIHSGRGRACGVTAVAGAGVRFLSKYASS